jgi:hypothetical protein
VDGSTWTPAGTATTIPMATTVYVGLAAASSLGGFTTGIFDDVFLPNATPDFYLTTIPSSVKAPSSGSVTYPLVAVFLRFIGSPCSKDWGRGLDADVCIRR